MRAEAEFSLAPLPETNAGIRTQVDRGVVEMVAHGQDGFMRAVERSAEARSIAVMSAAGRDEIENRIGCVGPVVSGVSSQAVVGGGIVEVDEGNGRQSALCIVKELEIVELEAKFRRALGERF